MSLQLDAHTADILKSAGDRFGTPCYVYMVDRIRERAREIQRAFEDRFEISYAVKANPNRALLREIDTAVSALDVSSGGELHRGIECGYAPERLSFSGPGKSIEELAEALDLGCGDLITESMSELTDLNRLAEERNRKANVVLRISPSRVPKGFGVSMARRPSQFGIDQEALDETLEAVPQLKHLHLAGFHIFAGAQCLDIDSIVENFENYISIFTDYGDRHNLKLDRLIFGGGIGIPYSDRDQPVDLGALARRVNPMLDALRDRPRFGETRCFLEIGRMLVGEAGYFLTRVRRAKTSRGKEIRICDGGMNNHLAACGHFGSVIHRNYPIANLEHTGAESPESENSYEVFGPLCTTIDQIARDLKLPSLEPGDVLAIGSSGAYGHSASPMKFISHPPAKEVIASTVNGKIQMKDVSENEPS